jgi:hypothetical protein
LLADDNYWLGLVRLWNARRAKPPRSAGTRVALALSLVLPSGPARLHGLLADVTNVSIVVIDYDAVAPDATVHDTVTVSAVPSAVVGASLGTLRATEGTPAHRHARGHRHRPQGQRPTKQLFGLGRLGRRHEQFGRHGERP